MIRAIAIKELRETVGIAVIALMIYAAIVSAQLGVLVFWWMPGAEVYQEVPFAGGVFARQFAVVSCALAIALGLRQSAWEGIRGTYLFLLHRPALRGKIFAAKVLTGLALLQLTAALPVLLYGAWASLPNTHASPFEWSMTESTWSAWLVLPVVYLGAFLSGLRTARWTGTRLTPLLAALAGFVGLGDQRWWIAAGRLAAGKSLYVVDPTDRRGAGLWLAVR